jgi:tetratricopeptide (TPR) repeat protein
MINAALTVIQGIINIANALIKGDFETAHKEFAEVKKLNPADPRLPAAEGEVFMAEIKIAEAIEQFEAATKLDPKRGTNWSRLAYLYGLKGEKAKSRAAVNKALAANPKDFNALDSLADLQLGEGKVDDAAKSFAKAMAAALAPPLGRGGSRGNRGRRQAGGGGEPARRPRQPAHRRRGDGRGQAGRGQEGEEGRQGRCACQGCTWFRECARWLRAASAQALRRSCSSAAPEGVRIR